MVGKGVESKSGTAQQAEHQHAQGPIGAGRQPLHASQGSNALEHGTDEQEGQPSHGELHRARRKDQRPSAADGREQVGDGQEGRRQQKQGAGLPKGGDGVRDRWVDQRADGR